MNRSEEIHTLCALAKAISERDLAELARNASERNRATEARSEFCKQARLEDETAVEHIGYRKDHELGRRIWRERRQYALGHYEARAAAVVEQQKKVAIISFGRAQVLAKLSEQIDPKGGT